MSNVSFILLYVENVARSAEFYARLLEKPVIESSPTFAMMPVGPHLMLGLWRRDGVQPAAGAPGGGGAACGDTLLERHTARDTPTKQMYERHTH